MYTTSQIVERVLLLASEFSAGGVRGVLPVVNEINHLMMGADIDDTVVIDAATGTWPVLATTSGVFQYDCPDNCRKVADILISEENRSSTYNEDFHYRQVVSHGQSYYSIRNVITRRRKTNQNATITFPANPGTTTDLYLLKYYVQPTTISSVNIQIDVPPDFHPLFIDGCVARIQPIQYGRPNPFVEWQERMKMEFWAEMNDNKPVEVLRPRRPC